MEDKLLNLYLEARKNYTQIVSFVSGGIAIVIAAILTSSADPASKAYIAFGVSIVSIVIVAIHFNAYSEHKEISAALFKAQSPLASVTEKFNKIIFYSGIGFVAAAIICAALSWHYLEIPDEPINRTGNTSVQN